MKLLFRLFSLALLYSFLFSCTTDNLSVQTEIERPYSPWVFRSVLDEQPRMITLALHDDLWAAYSTEKCQLYKIWKGRVNFDGAVYTTMHGPQPTSIGDAYLVNNRETNWSLKDAAGNDIPMKLEYKGHRYIDGHAQLMYAINISGNTIPLYEQVEASTNESGQVRFERTFICEALPEGYNLTYTSDINSIVVESNIETDGEHFLTETKNEVINGTEVLSGFSSLKLNDGETQFNLTLIDNPAIINPNKSKYTKEDSEAFPPGAKLIARNDCKSCHSARVKTIGPSYLAISKKYHDNQDNIEILTNKIKRGGGGVWGPQLMTPHPELTDTEIGSMLSYILSLGDPESADGKELDSSFPLLRAQEADLTQLMPGAITRVYNIPEGTKSMPDFSKLKPIMAGIMPSFDNISNNDFDGLEENFAIHAQGFIEIPETGIYDFRIWSDDGSIVYIDGQEVLNHDGPHGTSMKEVRLQVEKGLHKFTIHFFQGLLGKFLSFNYKPLDSERWMVVPPSMILHHQDDHKLIGNLSLPMSVSSEIPGNQAKLNAVHPSFDLAQARPDIFTPKVGGLDFLSDGRIVVSTWDPTGAVYLVDHRNAKNPNDITYKKIAEGLAEPLGLKVVDDEIFIMQKQEMTRLVDTNGDDIIDEYHTLCDDWGVSANFHEFGFGLDYKDGHFYATLATGIQPGGASALNQHKNRGNAIKVNKESGAITFLAHGLRTPNGVGVGHNDEIFVADNEGDWLPSSKIVHVKKGNWFGSRSVDFEGTADLTATKPVVWLPQDEIGNSPTTPIRFDHGPYQNQMIHGDVYHGGIKRVFVEEVNGGYQGCVFRFSQGLEAGVNRLRQSPDGDIYVGGIGNPGNWGQQRKYWYGLQRLSYNEKPTFEMLAVRAKSNGIEIEFTQPLDGLDGWNPGDYGVKQWYYLPTVDYGGPKMDEQVLLVKSTTVSEDAKRVFLEIDGIKENHVVYIHLRKNFISKEAQSLWSTEAWYTMNYIPANKNGVAKTAPISFEENKLKPHEVADGWVSLFDGQQISEWHNFNKAGQPLTPKWKIQDDAIHFDGKAKGEGGDLISNKEYENFELALDWKISNCGNSGIMFNVVEDEKYCCPYLTGPEMQVLDNTCHPDTRYVTHRAGDLYDMIEAQPVTVRPAGEWNEVRIRSKDGAVRFWLNGYEVVSFQMHNEEWKAMIAKSKFSEWADFGMSKKGRIALQDHDNRVWYRNIKIKEL